MAPIPIAEITSFSSEDPRYPAHNVVKGQKWLSDPRDTSGKAVLELRIDKASKIHYIDIGYNNASSLEVSVGRSTWPSSRNFSIILPTVVLQTPTDARSGKNKIGCRMFNFPEHLNPDFANERWDRIRINLTQTFAKNKQIGLEFVRLASPRNATSHERTDGNQIVTSSPGQDSDWKNSPLARLAQPITSKNRELHNLESKLLRISGTIEDGSDNRNTLSRTAKMVLSSRSGNMGPNHAEKQTPLTPTNNKKKILNQKLISPKYSKGQTSFSPISLATDLSQKTSFLGEPGAESGARPSCKDSPKNISGSIVKTKTKLIRSNLSPKLCNGKNSGVERLGTYSSPQPAKRSHDAQDMTRRQSIDGACPTSSGRTLNETPGCSTESSAKCAIVKELGKESCTENWEINELSKFEIKKIKKNIQQFFNSLNIDDIDPDNITLKDLRIAFEGTYDVQLDKDGRQYFKTVTADFLELAMTMRQHKHREKGQTSVTSSTTPTRKRKSSEKSPVSVETSQNSPAKIRRFSQDLAGSSKDFDCEILSVQNKGIQCPLCMRYFSEAIIADHAAVCGEEEEVHDLENQGDDDLQITSVSSPPRQQFQTLPGETFLDLSDNMRLSEEEKRRWAEFARKPKPYHPRMNNGHLRGHQLVKCPSCGQFYKSDDIEEHSDECAEKVYSGLEKRGLYYVRKDESIVKNNS